MVRIRLANYEIMKFREIIHHTARRTAVRQRNLGVVNAISNNCVSLESSEAAKLFNHAKLP